MRSAALLLAACLAAPPAAAQGIDIVFPGGRVRIGGDRPAEEVPPPVDGVIEPIPEDPAPLYGPDAVPPADTLPPAPADDFPTLAPPPTGAAPAAPPERIAAFRDLLTDATLTGRFTVDGAAGEPKAERYDIASAEPVDGSPTQWVITTRIRYGEKDFTLPVVVDVLWAGSTPMIVLEESTIPGMGTFSAHVLFDGDRYAGTWQHDEKGGHLFGTVGPTDEAGEES